MSGKCEIGCIKYAWKRGEVVGKYILALDQSTSASKAMIVDSSGNILIKKSKEHKQYYPKPGWVEHDPEEIYENVKVILLGVVSDSKFSFKDLAVLAITNQRETVVVWDKHTGEPIYNAIVWQCRRTSDMCTELKSKDVEGAVRYKTGLMMDPYFSATKVKWILDNVEGARKKANEGRLLLGNIDTWLMWKLTKGKVHATDYTNASRTLLFNIRTLKWDDDLMDIFGIPRCMLPEIKYSDEIFGFTESEELHDSNLPISGVIGDSQGALFGQQCFEPGIAKVTYGTGSSILMNVGDRFIESNNGLVTTVAWGVDGKIDYALEGIIHCTGDTLRWIKDNLGLISSFNEIEPIINLVKDNEGVYLVPAFIGLGIPYWDTYARAAIVGLSRGSKKEHVVRAAVESIAYQIKDAIDLISADSNIQLLELRADGGPTKNLFLMQFQADMLNSTVVCSDIAELSSMGSVYLAGLGVGVWKSRDEIKLIRGGRRVFSPGMDRELRDKYYEGWKRSVHRVLEDTENCL
jgi:glycerol kinase